MKFQPKNDYLLVERLKKQDEDGSSFTVPDHLKPNTKASGTEIVKLIDGSVEYAPHTLLAVEATMLEDFSFEGKQYVLVGKMYVKGVFQNES